MIEPAGVLVAHPAQGLEISGRELLASATGSRMRAACSTFPISPFVILPWVWPRILLGITSWNVWWMPACARRWCTDPGLQSEHPTAALMSF